MKHSRSSGSATRPRRRRLRILLPALIGVIVFGAIAVWLLLPKAILRVINHELRRSHLYSGTVGGISLDLWRGAYSVSDIKISKTTAAIPVPFFSAERVFLSVEWSALAQGRVVARVHLLRPEINFVHGTDESDSQTGGELPWLQMLQELSPFQINSALIQDGSVHFRTYRHAVPVNVYLSEVHGELQNLSNVRKDTAPLAATLEVEGLVMDHARFEFNMQFDPFSYRPTFEMATRIIGLDVTTINDLAMAYGNWDFQHGWFDFVLEMEAREGQYTGYAKPLFRNIQILNLKEDIREKNPLQLFWEAIVGTAFAIFSNPPRDQFGTLIPFSGDLSNSTSIDIPATIGNVLRNAFVRAYLPSLEPEHSVTEGITFGPPEFIDTLAAGVPP